MTQDAIHTQEVRGSSPCAPTIQTSILRFVLVPFAVPWGWLLALGVVLSGGGIPALGGSTRKNEFLVLFAPAGLWGLFRWAGAAGLGAGGGRCGGLQAGQQVRGGFVGVAGLAGEGGFGGDQFAAEGFG